MDEDEVEEEDEDEDEDEVEGEFVYLGVFGMRDSPRCAEKLCPPGGGQKTLESNLSCASINKKEIA